MAKRELKTCKGYAHWNTASRCWWAWQGAQSGATDACYIVPKAEHERNIATRKAARALCEHASCITNAIRGRKGCKEALAALDALVEALEPKGKRK